MKKQSLLIISILLIVLSGVAQNIEPAPADKAVVYFMRTSSLGMAINFSFFDSTTLIGVFNAPKYIRYECEPGQHIFWARSENKDYIEAEVEAGKIYFIEAIPLMGAIKAGVDLQPVDTNNEKQMKAIRKLMTRKLPEYFTPEKLQYETARLQDVIQKGIEKYHKDKSEGTFYPQLSKDMDLKMVQQGAI